MPNNPHPFDHLFTKHQAENENTVTVKEAAETLHLSESTIYNYVKDGILKATESPFADKIRITMESIQQFQQKNNEEIEGPGISLNSLAKRMNITKARLQKIIEAHNIHIPKTMHGKREQYQISDEIQEQIYKILLESNHFPKTPFFNSRKNIALYQAFTSKINQNVYRIERVDDTWGIRTPSGILPFENAKARYELVPNYSLRQRVRNSISTVTIRLPLDNEYFYTLIDTIYATFGMDNIQFKYFKDQELWIFVKASTYKLQTPKEQVLLMNNFLDDGIITIDNHNITLSSFDITVTVTLSKDLIPKFNTLTKQSNLTYKQYIEKLIKEHLSQANEENHD